MTAETAASGEVMVWQVYDNLKAETFFHAFPFARNAAREVIEKSITDLGL